MCLHLLENMTYFSKLQRLLNLWSFGVCSVINFSLLLSACQTIFAECIWAYHNFFLFSLHLLHPYQALRMFQLFSPPVIEVATGHALCLQKMKELYVRHLGREVRNVHLNLRLHG